MLEVKWQTISLPLVVPNCAYITNKPTLKKWRKHHYLIYLTSAILSSVLVFSLNHHSSILKIESFLLFPKDLDQLCDSPGGLWWGFWDCKENLEQTTKHQTWKNVSRTLELKEHKDDYKVEYKDDFYVCLFIWSKKTVSLFFFLTRFICLVFCSMLPIRFYQFYFNIILDSVYLRKGVPP